MQGTCALALSNYTKCLVLQALPHKRDACKNTKKVVVSTWARIIGPLQATPCSLLLVTCRLHLLQAHPPAVTPGNTNSLIKHHKHAAPHSFGFSHPLTQPRCWCATPRHSVGPQLQHAPGRVSLPLHCRLTTAHSASSLRTPRWSNTPTKLLAAIMPLAAAAGTPMPAKTQAAMPGAAHPHSMLSAHVHRLEHASGCT